MILSLELPDPNDLQVLAEAIVSSCEKIVTKNLKHFPESVLKPHGIEPVHPDDFFYATAWHLHQTCFVYLFMKFAPDLGNRHFPPKNILKI